MREQRSEQRSEYRSDSRGDQRGDQRGDPRGSSRRPDPRSRKRKSCPFTAAGIREIDYKDVDTLSQFITEKGKILPRRITGVSAFHQRLLSKAIKCARHMALLPFVADH